MSKKHNFSIEWILGPECGAKKPKTSTNQNIECSNLQENDQYGGEALPIEDNAQETVTEDIPQQTVTQEVETNVEENLVPDFEKFCKKLGSKRISSKKFKVDRSMTSFSFEKLEESQDPEKIVFQCLKNCIEEAIDQGRKDGQDPDKIGIFIESSNIPGGINIPLRPINENTLDAIFNKIMDVNSHYDSPDLYGGIFEIHVTTACAKAPGKSGKYSKQLNGTGKCDEIVEFAPTSAFIRVENDNSYCLFYACELSRIYNTKNMNKTQFHNLLRSKNKLKQQVIKLMGDAGIPLDKNSYDAEEYLPKLQSYYNERYPGKYKIFIFNRLMGLKPCYVTDVDEYAIPITIYHADSHFNGIRHLSSFFKKPYCLSCESTFDSKSKHRLRCKNRCLNCSEMGPNFPCQSQDNFRVKCNNCDKTFVNEECFRRHIKNNFCKKSKKCLKCGIVYSLCDVGERGHVCEEGFCQTCKSYHTKDRGCFIRKEAIPKAKNIRYVFFDMECLQERTIKDKHWHEANFIAATTSCNKCMESENHQCNICGPVRSICFSHVNFSKTKYDKVVLSENPLAGFLDWVIGSTKACKTKTILYSHYGGRYDMVLLFGELFRKKVITPPEVIRRGCKIYQIKIQKGIALPAPIIFRDSFNFVGMALSQFVSTFQLDMENKMYFPHFYNKRKNYNTILPHLPTESDYNYNAMKPKNREAFLKWYKDNYSTPFDLNETLAEYCLSDVNILAAGMKKFRALMLQVTKIDILETSMTMASACLKHWRTNHIKDQHVAIISELGHDVKHNQSEVALKYMKWLEETEGLKIHTYDDYGGEHKLNIEGQSYLLDGYVKGGGQNGRDLAIEVHGCVWHGHTCVGEDTLICPNGNTVEQNRKRTFDKEEAIKTIMDLRVIYECEINEELKKNTKMKEFFSDCVVGGPINPRHAFHGGRTGPVKLYAKYRPGYEIKYHDFVSLYPAVIKEGRFPVKHPKLEILNKDVNWTSANDNPYLGILKVLILPPKKISQPVVPLKVDERLLFPLCRRCSLKYKDGAHTVVGKRLCKCSDKDRAFVSTITHMELNLALENGYVVKKLFRVNKFEEEDFDDELFKSYVQEFMKIKIESSGFPSDKRTTEEREVWIKENEDIYGIKLDPSNMTKNEGMRWIAKTCLNSLWGRLALRNNLCKTKIICDPDEIYQLHCDARIEIDAIENMDDDMECMQVTYSPKEGYVDENPASNILISLWTTSLARMKLYGEMKKVSETDKCSLLYTDTDSLIHEHPKGKDPLEDNAGDHLGQLKDELPTKQIVEYVSSGCKAYGLKTVDKCDMAKWINCKESVQEEISLKVRSISFDHRTSECLPYDKFKEKVFEFAQKGKTEGIKVTYPHSLKPDKIGNVWTISTFKTFEPKCSKGIVTPDFDVLPFGY